MAELQIPESAREAAWNIFKGSDYAGYETVQLLVDVVWAMAQNHTEDRLTPRKSRSFIAMTAYAQGYILAAEDFLKDLDRVKDFDELRSTVYMTLKEANETLKAVRGAIAGFSD